MVVETKDLLVRCDDGRISQTADAHQDPAWHETEGKVYECWFCLVPEDSGGYSVYMPDLPGVVSQGETEEEAIHNIEEAFLGAAEVYEEMGQPIPWSKDHQPRPANAKERWILVNA